jgi:hypothetical protein
MTYPHLRRAWYTERQTEEGNVMSAPTVQISETSHKILKELADQTGQTITDVLDKAVDAYRRKLFFERLNAAYAALRADPAAWAEVEEERRSMDGCLMDGLDPHECWANDGDLLPPKETKDNG